jgi:hypothetical protein
VGDTAVGVRTTSDAFGDWLDATLGAYRVDDVVEPEYSVVVDEGSGSGRRFNVLYQGVGVVSRALDLGVVARSLLRELEARLLRSRTDGVYVHYGVARSDRATALVPSWLVAYLTGTGRRLAKSGITLPIARWARVDADTGMVTPPPRVLDVPADALARLPMQGSADAYADASRPRAVDAVVTYDQDMDTISAGTRGRALSQLVQNTANLRVFGAGAMGALGRLVEGAHCFDTGLGRAHQMLSALEGVFDHERRHLATAGERT